MMELQDVYNIEGKAESAEEYARSLQTAVNSGMAWRLQGSYGRAASAALDSGMIMLPDVRHTDYWGNTVPARSDLQPGTKGTRELVVEQYGESWALMLEGVE